MTSKCFGVGRATQSMAQDQAEQHGQHQKVGPSHASWQ